ncbi:DUF6765 family protein [Butyrivibrio proteoclasticus]|uniref:DUF6765 family protein n=1 Tax=Butyrivibrio proteoclasticus TaxID=43305 RepID=UPI00047E8F1D|nr:DUF6765 family protein [Butyrivibrio proteoclasticus]
MQEDFHYYATYCAAYLAGYSHEESLEIAYSAQFVDLCSRTFLSKIGAPLNAATTQLQLEMMDARTDIIGLQDITRIWAAFHFLPQDLYAQKPRRSKRYMQKYRLICGPNGDLLAKTVENARGKSLQHVGIAMHVLADTWAHRYFAGTPSLVINNTEHDFVELLDVDGEQVERPVKFRHSPTAADDLENGIYTNSLFQGNENSIMNLGHGRAGHFPDYSFAKYRYMPAWGDYQEIEKDNPADYEKAFAQMVYAMKFLRGELEPGASSAGVENICSGRGAEVRGAAGEGERIGSYSCIQGARCVFFRTGKYDEEVLDKYGARIREILTKRQLIASDDWKRFGEELSGHTVEDFDIEKYQEQYVNATKDGKDKTFIGKFIRGAISQKGMVTEEIHKSGNMHAGFSKLKRVRALG